MREKIAFFLIYLVIPLFQRTLLARHAERCGQRSCGGWRLGMGDWVWAIGRLIALSPYRLIALLPHFQRAFELGEETNVQIAIGVHIRC